MKIAITGEGKTDFGQKEYSTGKWLPGPAIVYAENIAKEKGVEVEFIPIEKEDVKKVKLQRRSSKEVSGRGIPARKFRILMGEGKYDAGIFYCDADKETGVNSIQGSERWFKLRQRDTDDTFKHDRVLDIGRQISIRASI